ncbi:hypothetical protein [Chitinilyticum litopenaei]|uniref:hypothetical protein n=1 Tax=Chitinilyticum litopenaei TaxID=1121276 RepID=UPI001186717E|nr:hypothetical protein [Chitinilyticum litopenaei]
MRKTIVLITIIFTTAAYAEECSTIKNAKTRLFCYDKLHKPSNQTKQSKILSEEQIAINSALHALRRLQSAVRSGLNKIQYSDQKIDMHQAVDESLRSIPDSDIKKIIIKTSEHYDFAGEVWNSLFTTTYADNFWNLHESRLEKEYGVRRYDSRHQKTGVEAISQKSLDIDTIFLQVIWQAANRQLAVAELLNSQRSLNDMRAIPFLAAVDRYYAKINANENLAEEALASLPNWPEARQHAEFDDLPTPSAAPKASPQTEPKPQYFTDEL